MNLIQALGRDLDITVEIVKAVREKITESHSASQKPVQQLTSDRGDIPSASQKLTAALEDVSKLAADATKQLHELQTALLAEAARVQKDGESRTASLEASGKDFRANMQRLTADVKAATQDLERRGSELTAAAGSLSKGAETGSADLAQAAAPAKAALEASASVAKSTYNHALFNDLAAGLKTLRGRLDHHAAETVPAETRKAKDELAGTHDQGVKQTLQQAETATAATHADFLSKTQASAASLREAVTTEMSDAGKLATETLPQRTSETVGKQLDPALHDMFQIEGPAFSAAFEKTMDHLNKAQFKFYKATFELHEALRKMVG